MDSETPQKSWFAKHKILTGLGIFILLAMIGSAMSGNKSSNTDTATNKTPAPQADEAGKTASEQTTAPAATPKLEKMTISNSTAKQTQYGVEVNGEIKNNDTIKHSATLKTTFYDKAGKIMGTAGGAVNDVEPGDTKTFTLMGTDNIAGYDHLKTQVDTLL
jgi:cytoskeletal protein RodZ